MFGVVVFILLIVESVEPSCLYEYWEFSTYPILIRGNVLEIPLRYYANCSRVTHVNLNAVGEKVKLDSLDFVKYFQPTVTFLDASNNNIVDLPQLINAVHLTTMFLRNNKINDISHISEFRYLETINLAENKIKFLPEITLSNLKVLILRKNIIKLIKPSNLRASPNIILLQLDGNLLRELRMCEFKNKISTNVTENPNFSCKIVLCVNCICTDSNRSVEIGRDFDVCPRETQIYFMVTGVVLLPIFIVICLICVIVWKRRRNRCIEEEPQSRNSLSMNSLPITPITPPPKYEFRNYQNGQVIDEIGHGNPLGNIHNYDYVYDHFRRKRHVRLHQENGD